MIVLLIPAGLATRRFGAHLPSFFAEYAPDALWASMVYFLFRVIIPKSPIWKNAIAALLFSYCIEFSQLYHAPWIDKIRSYRLGGLVLGFGFLWSDLICYTVGVGLAVLIDRITAVSAVSDGHTGGTPMIRIKQMLRGRIRSG